MSACSRPPLTIYRNDPPPRFRREPVHIRREPPRPTRRRRHSAPSLLLAGLLLFASGVLLGWTIAVTGNAAAQHSTQPSENGGPGGSVSPYTATSSRLPPAVPDWVTVDLLPVNEWSRPGDPLEQVNGVVVHYVGNPGTTARQNRSYFGYLAETHETYASSHFLVGMDGEVIQCVPLDEIAYCSNSRNSDTIAIECCHPDDSGEFTASTLDSLKKLLDWLAGAYGLGREQILRHYDVTGKECPVYYVDNPQEWEALLDSLAFSAAPPVVSVPGEGGAADWSLALVNRENPISRDFTVPELTQLVNGQSIDSRVYPALQDMMDGARAAGYRPLICSSFRTWDIQSSLFQRKVQSCLDQGYSQADAEQAASCQVARPGTSEHQLGLAVDIVDIDYQLLDETQEDRPVQQWLMDHCADYGFILRYPTGKSGLTGVDYEPWHYRYVGEEAARAIMEGGLCLEEYLGNPQGPSTTRRRC